ncbi:unnamed protein product [Lactuca virosa]|uniref:Uncharacterized protein n=1 Tax=Lactuca virosa TaxID=75947 RepID=A0AAU9NKW3_9ASTR|nr:unnamed protein product [Lactuca virosa]
MLKTQQKLHGVLIALEGNGLAERCQGEVELSSSEVNYGGLIPDEGLSNDIRGGELLVVNSSGQFSKLEVLELGSKSCLCFGASSVANHQEKLQKKKNPKGVKVYRPNLWRTANHSVPQQHR